MPESILGLIPQTDWLNVGLNVIRPNDPIDSLFGDERTNNIMASWQSIASEYQVPVMANFHAFDAEAMKTFRAPVDTHNIEKGLIKVKINQTERMRQLLRSGVRDNELYDYVIRDGVRLADQVVTRTKVAKNEVMATGKMTIKENNLDLTVDYGVPASQTSYSLNLSADSDIFGQIQSIVDDAANNGIIITGMMTARKNITKMRQNKAIQTSINGNIGAGAIVSRTAFDAYLEQEFGINRVITNDLTYGIDDGVDVGSGRPKIVTKRYYPDNKVTFFAANPGGRIGTGLWGDPPEVDLSGDYSVETSSESPYVYVTQKYDWDPAVLWTKASALFIPVLYNPNSLIIATVLDTSAGG